MKSRIIKCGFAMLAVTAMTFAAQAGGTFTWTGRAGNQKWSDAGNWSLSGKSDRTHPSWTDSAIFDTGAFGGDITVLIDNGDHNADLVQTKGPGKVTFNAADGTMLFRPYNILLYARDNEFNVNVRPYALNRARDFSIYSNATFNKDVYLPDTTVFNNRSDKDGTCLGVQPNAIHFYGKLELAAGKVLCLRRAPYTSYAGVHFHGPLVCDELRFGLGWSSGYAYFYSTENQIGAVKWAYSQFVCCNDNVYPASLAVSWPSSLINPVSGGEEFYWDNTSTYSAFNLNGHDQSASMVSYAHASRRPWITSGSPAVLTLNGFGEAVANVRVGGKVSLAIDSPGLVQDFRDSQSDTSGRIDVKQGTFRLSGASSFVNVTDVSVGAGATFDLSSTATGAMGGLTNVTVAAGGTFKVGSGVFTPLGIKLAIRLEEGAFIDAGSDFVIPDGLWVNGERVEGGTYESAAWKKGTGKITVNASNEEAIYVWTGLGGDGRISTPANWQDGVKPSFTSTRTSYVFPSSGATEADALQIIVDTPVTCRDLSFTSPIGGYVVMTAAGAGKVTIIGGDVNVTNTTGVAVQVKLDVPVEFSNMLTIQCGSTDKKSVSYGLAFRGGLNSIGSVEIIKFGYGYLRIVGESNMIRGDIHNYAGCLQLEGADPVGGGSGFAIRNYPEAGDTATIINIEDATINRNIVTRNPNDMCGPTIRATGMCTINGNVSNNAGNTTNSGHMRIHVGSQTKTGYCVVNGSITANNNGFFVLSGGGGCCLKLVGLLDCVRVYCDAANETTFDVARIARGLSGPSYSWFMKIPVRISADNCIYRDVQGDQCYQCLSGYAGIDLNGHKLTLCNFGCDQASHDAGGCYIKGGVGSTLTVNGDINDSVGIHILEAASLVRAGTGTTTISDPCPSTGALDVTGGLVEIKDDGCWENASKVTIGGGTGAAKVRVSNGKGFGKQTVLNIATNGKLELAEGVTARVGELWLNGVRQPIGVWGSDESEAEDKNNTFFAGKGKVVVGNIGLTIFVQ